MARTEADDGEGEEVPVRAQAEEVRGDDATERFGQQLVGFHWIQRKQGLARFFTLGFDQARQVDLGGALVGDQRLAVADRRALGQPLEAVLQLARGQGTAVRLTQADKQDLIDNGWLVPYRAFSCAEPDLKGVKVNSMGEWDEKETSKKALEVVGDVVAEYLKHGDGRKFICSGVDTAHVEELARQFLAAGINVAQYTYKVDEDERADVTTEFRKPDSTIRGLITVTAASRGFDVPDVSCVIMARPLRKSLAEHIQLLGRGLRIADGKSDCVILDHSGNVSRFWASSRPRSETLAFQPRG